MKPGFKQTEAGVIPEDWACVLLSDIVDFANGKPHEGDVEPDGLYWLITLDSIGIDGQLKAEHRRTNKFDFSLKKHDIVSVLSDIAHGNLLGLCDVVPTDDTYVLNQRMGRLRLKVSADPEFVRLQINRRQAHFKTRGQGTSQKHIYKRDFNSLAIPFPNPSEQEAIAEALSDAAGVMVSLERLLAKKRDLKQGAMQELLTGKKRLRGFNGAWQVKRLGDVVEINKGELITEGNAIPGPIPVIAGGKRPAYFHNSANRSGKTITISGSGASAGYVAYYDGPIFASDCSTIGEGQSYAARFIYFTLLLNQNAIYKAQTGGAQPHIHPSDLRPLAIAVPPTIDEQIAIATILFEMDAEIAALDEKLGKARSLKQGMMQELLTGKIRLV